MPIRITPTVKILLIVNLAIFLIQQTADQFMGGNLLGIFGLVPYQVVMSGWIWQLFTYAFLHGDVMHLFLNLLMLFFIGSELEAVWGRSAFLKYFFFCSIFAGLVYLGMQVFIRGGLGVPMVGASGGIYGLLLAYGILFGERTLLFMMLFPMKAKHFIWILAGVEFMTSLYSRHGGLAAVAHLGGMVAGLIYLYGLTRLKVSQRDPNSWINRVKNRKKTRRKRASHLKLVVGQDKSKSDDDDSTPPTWH